MVACRMKANEMTHQPVMLNEVIANLVTKMSGIYVDATFGRGGHAQSILKQLSAEGRLIAIDKDLEAIEYAKQTICDSRFTIEHGSFSELTTIVDKYNLTGRINGILFDLGVSSPQLDQAHRGFSFMQEGELDMRMNTTKGITAAEWLACVDETELAYVLWTYGEERFSRRIAKAIVEKRVENPIKTTTELAAIIASAIPKWEKHKHPATRSFQAIRIAINEELDDLKKGLDQALEMLTIGGRLAVISFHSLEDRIVKQFIQKHQMGGEFPRGLPLKNNFYKPRLKRLRCDKKPSAEECAFNPRARSAVLRIAEKLI